ncbi:MAG TPA: Ig-like domain-containing protein [Gemmatimonadaceae bacterium]|nr:Ig-like domain-containing protein [Gemmatimonadaceae bacterium]
MITLVLMGASAAYAGCASPGMPPGGPVDTEAPVLIAVAPESGSVRTSPRSVVFRFDEVVTERPAAAPNLGSFFIISPQEGTPVVGWSRSEINVRPRQGWRPNTTYTITMLPGITDLRGNVSRDGAVVVFSTGAEIPQTRLSGQAFDWSGGTVAVGALIQAITPDSVIYSTVADSSGIFALAHLPPGQYLLQAIMDDNRNRALDPRERFDSVTIVLRDTLSANLLTFVRDSVPPRLASVGAQDSVTVRLNFDLPLEPGQSFDLQQFTIVGADSAVIQVRGAVAVDPDTPAVRLPRPVPPRALSLRVVPLQADATYRVRVTGVRGLTGVSGPSERPLRTPAEFQPDTAVVSPAVP